MTRSQFFDYRLASGRTLPVETATAWCARCAAVVEAERLVSLEEIDAELAAAGDGKRHATNWWGEGRWKTLAQNLKQQQGRPFRDGYIAALKVIRIWRQDRRSPPRCLSCGATDVFDGDSTDTFRHPDCGGLIRETDQQHDVVQWVVEPEQLFSSEGERLP